MDYNYLDRNFDVNSGVLPNSDKINLFLKKNNESELKKGLEFISSNEILLYIHGFLGTGKRQFINYLSEFFDSEVIKLEYYCKQATVCDDIVLSFVDKIEQCIEQNQLQVNVKITALSTKLQHHISSIKRPFVIILHSFDNISEENREIIISCFEKLAENTNIKFIVSTRALITNIMGNVPINRKIFLKGLSKPIFKEYLNSNKISVTDTTIDDFYSYTRGYYYYTSLAIKVIQAMKLSANEFLSKFTMSGMSFDSYLGDTYINFIPAAIRNFFWFLKTIRHGVSLNALAVLELYDEFSIEYLKTNLIVFVADDIIYVQDYFQQDTEIAIPDKTLIKLHKYIIGIYEKELKAPLKSRQIMISRQAMRAEIEYHNECIDKLQNDKNTQERTIVKPMVVPKEQVAIKSEDKAIDTKITEAENCFENKNYTGAIEIYTEILQSEGLDYRTVTEIRHKLACVYKKIADYTNSQHYYELVERYYKNNNEVINLNYLYYEMTELYYLMYKNERAIETIKKVIYSVDTPQSLLVDSCTLLGNIYSDMNDSENAYSYYQKALDSLDENTSQDTLEELYFKYALANDEKGDERNAMEYYIKCISIGGNNNYKAPAYSNLGSCYFENNNIEDAKSCFEKAYKLEKSANNYDGIFYTASYLAKISQINEPSKTLSYLLDAKQSAEFINEDFYIIEATVALGDYYYNNISTYDKALTEYLKARKTAENLGDAVDISKIENRIQDMKLRMDKGTFEEITRKYE